MSALGLPLVYLLTFVAVALFVQTLAGMFFVNADRTQRVNRRLTMLNSGMSREQVRSALVRMPSETWLDDMRFSRLIDLLRLYLQQTGLSVSLERCALIALGVSGAIWAVALLMFLSAPGANLLINVPVSGLAALGLGFGVTALWLQRARRIRIKRIEEQLPVALDIVTRALRAGHPVISAIQLAAEEMSDPIGSELGLVVDENTYGIEFEDALANLAERTGSGDARFFAVSVNVQSETGGNLAEILGGLADVIRGRMTLGKRVKSLSSEGRTSAILISVLPVFVVGIQLLIHPTVYTDKFSDPVFWPAVLGTGVIYLIGWLIVRRIINFKY